MPRSAGDDSPEEQRYRSLVRRTGLGAFGAAADGRVTEANSTLAAMLGYDAPDDLRARDVAVDLYVDAEAFDRARARAVAHELGEWVETHWKRRDGSHVAVRVALRSVADADGTTLGVEGVVEDVSERRRRDELLRRSERMASLGTTLAGVAHELNNPLAAIMGFAQLLLRQSWPEEERSALEIISHEAERSAKIVHDLLTLARKREGDQRGPLALNEVVGYILHTRRYAMDTHGISCEMRLDPALPPVRGDRAQLEQVVLNLVTNAEEAARSTDDAAAAARSPRTPRISVRTWRHGAWVLLEVRDNGPGVRAGAESRIWDPFYTTRDTGDGTGLGLAVVHSIVTEHGGEVEFENDADGGARFVVRLPALATQRSEPAEPEPATAAHALDVLVADAADDDLTFVTRFLTSRGHAVLAASDAERALTLARRLPFDAVVCEVGMALAHPALLEPPQSVAAVAARAPRFVLAGEAPAGASLPPGAVIVPKPFDVEALRRAVEQS